MENLSARKAADAVRGQSNWKYALGLELTDPGLDASVLSEFRTRLLPGEAEQKLLDLLLRRLQEAGFVKAKGKQRTDSTHVIANIREKPCPGTGVTISPVCTRKPGDELED